MSGLERFAALVRTDEFDLAEACLLVAQDVYPDLAIAAYIGDLDAIAAAIRGRLPDDAFAEQKLQALNHHLFGEMRFRGNVEEYYDPRNSYLNQVLERRTGIPLTLSIVYMEVGRRLGLNIEGVSFPGHFLVKVAVKRGELVLDPFLGGESQSERQLRERLASVLPAGEAAKAGIETFLQPASRRQIVVRMLRNLKNLYRQAGRLEQALAVMQRMLVLMPQSAEELRDRGLLYQQLECFRPALSDLRSYLQRRPQARDAAEVHAQVVLLEHACSRLN
jgi:regulator of sirC expression with transglutaminase-like and TPR domain